MPFSLRGATLMIALLQRVTDAAVRVDGECIAAIGRGVLVLVAAQRTDSPRAAEALAARVLRLRLFADAAGKMNRSIADIGGALLVVPQFTLAADTRSGTRPSFTPAAAPVLAVPLIERFVAVLQQASVPVAQGRFGADMQVQLTNDGPVTFWLESPAPATTLP